MWSNVWSLNGKDVFVPSLYTSHKTEWGEKTSTVLSKEETDNNHNDREGKQRTSEELGLNPLTVQPWKDGDTIFSLFPKNSHKKHMEQVG